MSLLLKIAYEATLKNLNNLKTELKAWQYKCKVAKDHERKVSQAFLRKYYILANKYIEVVHKTRRYLVTNAQYLRIGCSQKPKESQNSKDHPVKYICKLLKPS